jgi:hypothetical protein
MDINVKEVIQEQQAYIAKQPTYGNFYSAVTDPNTPESDQELFVWHTVGYTETMPDGKTTRKQIELLATDPLEAINQAHEYLTNQ